MNNKSLIELKVALVISDPWEFGSECGTGPFLGVIKNLEEEKILIALDKSITYGGIEYYACICKPRHQGKEFKGILNGENISANIMLDSTNTASFHEVSGKTQAVIGSVKRLK